MLDYSSSMIWCFWSIFGLNQCGAFVAQDGCRSRQSASTPMFVGGQTTANGRDLRNTQKYDGVLPAAVGENNETEKKGARGV